MNLIKFKLMKTTKLIRWALCVAVLAAFGIFGCETVDNYSINSPDDLQDRIDSIAAVAESEESGDTTYIDFATTTVGETDFSSAWWGAHSDFFTIPTNKLLHLEFVNYGSGDNNWNNWNIVVTNVAASSTDEDASYEEYFILRSDAYGWGNDDYDGNLISYDYPDTDGDGDVWNDFLTTMDGASVTIEVDHSATGYAYVTATAVGTNGTTITETYNQPVSATDDIVAFLVTDASYFEMELAYLIPSKVTEVIDYDPASIAVSGTPVSVEIGSEDFWGDGVATVTFADGSSTEVDTADLSFNVDDMSTLGEKTVIVSYGKTKEGEYSDVIVSNSYTLEVTNSVKNLEITTMPDITSYYYYDDTTNIAFDTTGIVVTATYSDGTTAIMDNGSLEFGDIPPANGSQTIDISYVGSSTVTTTCTLTLVKGVSQVGATDFSTTWWTLFSDDYTVASGESKTFKMYCYSSETNNWNSPCTILAPNGYTQAESGYNAVTRMDNYGWGDDYGTPTLANDWDWDTFLSNINGSYIEITVTNNGDNTANVYYDVTYANGESHYQSYAGITVDSSDLTCALVTEVSYLVIIE